MNHFASPPNFDVISSKGGTINIIRKKKGITNIKRYASYTDSGGIEGM
tara:strand:+ start:754 stop:897 length:144 start_codon:yes stop_codon:yes gene_type:complete